MPHLVYVALGANLGEPKAALEEAMARLRQPDITLLRRARLYRSAPVGPQDQPTFWNTVVEIRTTLEPEALLDRLKAIEAALGRTPTVRWGPRVIDLDIVLFADRVVDTERLTVPHKEMRNRGFVLAPLADLAPDRAVPGGGTPRALLEALGPDAGLEVADHSVRSFAALD